MNAPTVTSFMEFEKSQVKYFIFVTQILIMVVSLYKIINEPSEKYWILVIVLSLLIFIFIISMFTNKTKNKNNFSPQLNSDMANVQKSNNINSKNEVNGNKNDESINENIPDVLDEGWDLPL